MLKVSVMHLCKLIFINNYKKILSVKKSFFFFKSVLSIRETKPIHRNQLRINDLNSLSSRYVTVCLVST